MRGVPLTSPGRPPKRGAALAGIAARAIPAPTPDIPANVCLLPHALVIALYVPRALRPELEAVTSEIAARVEASTIVVTRPWSTDGPSPISLRPQVAIDDVLGVHPAVFARWGADPVLVCRPCSASARAAAVRLLARPILESASHGYLLAPSREAALGLYYATSEDPRAPRCGTFPSAEFAAAAFAAGQLPLRAPIDLRVDGRILGTTVGRALLRALLPRKTHLDMFRPLHAGRALRLLQHTRLAAGEDAAREAAEALWSFGLRNATKAGFSLSMADLVLDDAFERERAAIIADARSARCSDALSEQTTPRWVAEMRAHEAFERAVNHVHEALPRWLSAAHPLSTLRDAGAGPDDAALAALVGLVPPAEYPLQWAIDRSLYDGLAPFDAFALATCARARESAIRARRGGSPAMQARLAAKIGDVRVCQLGCGARSGIVARPHVSNLRLMTPLRARVLGRVAAADVWSADQLRQLVSEGQIIDERLAERLDRERIAEVPIRSVLRCTATGGVCARCHGWDPETRRLPALDANVGTSAARGIAALHVRREEPTGAIGAVLYRRDALRACEPLDRAGTVIHHGVRRSGTVAWVAAGELGQIRVEDNQGNQVASYAVRTGYQVHCADGERVGRGATPVSTYVYGEPIVADIPEGASGVVSWETRQRDVPNRVTGLPDIDIQVVHVTGQRDDASAFVWSFGCAGDRFQLMVSEGATVRRGDLILLDRARPWPAHGWRDLDACLMAIEPPEPADYTLPTESLGRDEHIVEVLEDATLGLGARLGTVWFELLARALLERART